MLLSLTTHLIVHGARVTPVGLSRKAGRSIRHSRPISLRPGVLACGSSEQVAILPGTSESAIPLSWRRSDRWVGGRNVHQPARTSCNGRFALQLDRAVFQSRVCRIHRTRNHPSSTDGSATLCSQRAHNHDCCRAFGYAGSFASGSLLASTLHGSRRRRTSAVPNRSCCGYSSHADYARCREPTTRSVRLSHAVELSTHGTRSEPDADASIALGGTAAIH